ncbi:hypothetical protein CLV32_4039 [Pedobacter duraquae]|uniref:Uncharacterized protein n=1 Tax=Pedobacter duraquae TaxID=425511 RepID=A0A4V3C305_9SPHI|nr:hypothetical protein CLV32_4039 [Pedobacter duraquae]
MFLRQKSLSRFNVDLMIYQAGILNLAVKAFILNAGCKDFDYKIYPIYLIPAALTITFATSAGLDSITT